MKGLRFEVKPSENLKKYFYHFDYRNYDGSAKFCSGIVTADIVKHTLIRVLGEVLDVNGCTQADKSTIMPVSFNRID